MSSPQTATARRARREKRASRRAQRGLSREAKVLITIGIVLAFGAVAFLVLNGPSASSSNSAQSAKPQGAAVLVREDSYRQGPADAKVTLVEFLDPECEACGAMYPIVEQIRKEYGDRIQFVIRYFPLHTNSVLAVQAIEAAGRQDKYEAMYSTLFQNQSAWGEKREPQPQLFLEYARSIGLDMDQFQRDFNDTSLADKANRDKADGVAAGVKGTPTFFINGANAGSMMSYDQLKSKIDAALR